MTDCNLPGRLAQLWLERFLDMEEVACSSQASPIPGNRWPVTWDRIPRSRATDRRPLTLAGVFLASGNTPGSFYGAQHEATKREALEIGNWKLQSAAVGGKR